MFNLAHYERNPWSLFDEIESLQSDINRNFTRWPWNMTSRSFKEAYPPVNVWASDDGIVVDAKMPGVDTKDVDLTVQGNELTIRVHADERVPSDGEIYHRRERVTGEYARTLRLPYYSNPETVKASYINGLLRITIPRAESDKPKKIAVEAA
ncbi:MAG: Hsp20/alpha crystallin family protein [Lentisphaerae bacterium]|nr:Hsp20/alpha crystallin family protein [Lentisphaerota bacterium]